MNTLSYCGSQVRDHDRDRFLLSLLAPPSCHEALWALFAFNIEIAKTREVVSDSTLGRIRLQWWLDAITAVYDPPAPDQSGYGAARGVILNHEIVKPLADAILKYDLPRAEFETLIAARQFDLENRTPANMDEFLSYADGTSTPLFSLALQIAGGDVGLEPVQAVAMNYAIAGLLRAAVFHKARGRDILPVDAKEIAAHFIWKVKAKNRFLRASQKLAVLYMKQIRALDYDVFSPQLAVSVPFKELRLAIS